MLLCKYMALLNGKNKQQTTKKHLNKWNPSNSNQAKLEIRTPMPMNPRNANLEAKGAPWCFRERVLVGMSIVMENDQAQRGLQLTSQQLVWNPNSKTNGNCDGVGVFLLCTLFFVLQAL